MYMFVLHSETNLLHTVRCSILISMHSLNNQESKTRKTHLPCWMGYIKFFFRCGDRKQNNRKIEIKFVTVFASS